MPKYLMLIMEAEAAYENATEADFSDVMQQHTSFAREVEEAGGKILGGEALQPISTASYLRGTRADVATVDNPAPDLKEVLGGYYLVEVTDEDHARRIAERCPAPQGYVEVRPIWEFADTDGG